MTLATRPGERTLSRHNLERLVQFHADLWIGGAYPFVTFSEPDRWHRRVYHDDRFDVWLISWLPTQGTEMHDHGPSSGAFSVVRGELTEVVASGWSDGWMSLLEVPRPCGSAVSFGRHHIHDVVNRAAVPAVSIHAYSPPLTSMRFYDLAGGELVRTRSVPTDHPEAVATRKPS